MHFKLKFRAIPNRGNPVSNSVESVNGKTGVVVLSAEDVGADSFGSAQAVQESVDALSSDLDQALSLKSDKTYVDSQDQSLLDQINTKVDANYVNTVTADKASVSYVDTQDQALDARLSQAIDTKANAADLTSAVSMLDTKVNTKADKIYVDGQYATLSASITAKPTRAYVDQQDNALSGRIDQKADANFVEQSLGLKADLIDGKIPESQLPSVVDDVISLPSQAEFPAVGEDGKIYIAKDVNKSYRWTGSGYTEIGGGVALGETSATAYRGDRGKAAYDHALSSGNPHNTTTSEIPEGVNLYHTDPRVRMTQLTGINITPTSQVVATDYLIVALGKLQGQINTKTALVVGETVNDAYRGDRGKVAYDHSQVLGNPHNTVTGQISETTNLWFTENRVLNSVMSGVVFNNATAITQTDTLVQAVGKLQAQINTKTSLALGTTSTTAMAGNTTTSGITEGINLYFTDTRAKASAISAPLTGLSVATGGAITATDTVLAAMGKLQNQVTANGAGMTWVNVTSISDFAYESAVDTANTKIELCKFGGMLWIRGYIRFRAAVLASTEIFQMYNSTYLPDYTYVPSTLMTDISLYGASKILIDVNAVSFLNKWNMSTTSSSSININTSYHIRPQPLFKHA